MKQIKVAIIIVFIGFHLLNSKIATASQSFPPNRTILEGTFNIFHNKGNATAFLVNGNKKQYIVTAKHIFGNPTKTDSVVEFQIKGGKIEKKFKCNIYLHSKSNVDIAILKLDTIISNEVLSLGKDSSYFIGQECLFLGYPLFSLGTKTGIGKVPFVKSATISALHTKDQVDILLLDGFNNPGFSGGPIIIHNGNWTKQFIIGVISGYYKQPQKVSIKGNKTDSFVINENSGIIVSYPAKYIEEIIEKIETNTK